MGDDRFGPNTAQVERFFERLRVFTPAHWEQVMQAAPGAGSVPDLELKQSPEYFQALESAARVAKRNVFPSSESAFFDAMRTAQLVADASSFQPLRRPEPASSALGEERPSPEAEADALTRILSTAYEEESWRRVMTACMVAAGALVVRDWLTPSQYEILWQPLRVAR